MLPARRSYREALIFLALFLALFGTLAHFMGLRNLVATITNTAHHLLLNTVFYIMAVTVLSGALGALLTEFGVVRLLQLLLSPLMRPLFNLPGVAALAALITFLSDNPAVVSLTNDRHYRAYFSSAELVALLNLGATFGMGLIVLTYIYGKTYYLAGTIGLFAALCGGIISTRLAAVAARRVIPDQPADAVAQDDVPAPTASASSFAMRALNSILDGGRKGVDTGLAMIPGVLVITTLIMLVTFGPHDPARGYQGLACEGVPLLPALAKHCGWLLHLLFGFSHPEAVAFPVTSLGSVAGALTMIPTLAARGSITENDVAVFSAIGICWSGFVSTHPSMLDAIGCRILTVKTMAIHFFAGIAAGVVAHYTYFFVSFIT